MGMFDQVNLDDAVINDGSLPADVYPMMVTNFEIKPTAKGTMRGLNFTATVIAGKYKGRTYYQWMRVPHPLDQEPVTSFTFDKGNRAGETINAEQRKLDYLSAVKTLLSKLGIPESKMNEVESGDVIGIQFMGQIYKQKNTLESKLGNVQVKEFSDDDIAALDDAGRSNSNDPGNMFV